MDPFQKLKPGDRLRIPAELHSLLVDMAQEYARTRGDFKPGPALAAQEVALRVRNEHTSALPQFAVVRLGAELVAPDGADASFFGSLVYRSASPLAGEPFAVLQLPAARRIPLVVGPPVIPEVPGAIVPAVAAGITLAKVQMVLPAHEFAAPISGDYAKLRSQASPGPAEILWADAGAGGSASSASGSGVVWALIRFCCTAGTSAGSSQSLSGSQSPIETFLGKTTSTITALSGTTAGSGTAKYWQALTTTLTDQGTTITVYNASASAIASGTYVLLFREPFGVKLFAVPLVSGGGVVSATAHAFTATNTWTKPANLLFAVIELCGGGGAGGSSGDFSGVVNAAGGGGGAGGYAKRVVAASLLGATESVVVGARGIGAIGANGPNGGSSSFGSWLSATGGSGGIRGTTALPGGFRGSNGNGTNGDINFSGHEPISGLVGTGIRISGAGGSNYLGVGGGQTITDGFSYSGTGDGSGGGGSLTNTGVSYAGGDGTPGKVIVWEYFSS